MPQSVDKNWAWFVLFGACGANFLAGGIMFSFGILFTDFIDRLSPPVVHVASTTAIAYAFWCFAAPFSRAMTSRLGYRFVTILGGAVGFLGLLLCCFAPTIHYFYIFFGVLVGGGVGLISVATFIAVEDYFEKRNDISYTIASCGLPAGIFILPLITRALLETYSYFGTYMILSGLMLNVIVCGLLLKPLIKNAVIVKDSGTYQQMINPVENEQERSFDRSPVSQTAEDDHVAEHGGDKAEKEEKKKLTDPKAQRYKAVQFHEDTLVVPSTSATLRFDDYTIDDESEDEDDDEAESPVDDEVEPKPKDAAEKPTEASEPDKIDNLTQPDGVVKETKEGGKALHYVIIGLDDARMLCDGRIILYLLASIFFADGFGIPLTFFPDVSRMYGFSDTLAEWTLSLLGLGACVGIVFSDFARVQLSKRWQIASVLVVTLSSVSAGIFIGLVHFFTGYRIVLLNSFFFGLFSIVFLFLRRNVVEEIVEENYYKSAYYLSVWISGFGYIVMIPIAGLLKDQHNSYTWPCALAGISIGVCSLLICSLIFLKKSTTS